MGVRTTESVLLMAWLDEADADPIVVDNVTESLAAIETAAIASVLDVDRVAAALHSRCVEEYAHAAKVDPTRLLTMHMADAHHDAAARVVAALTGGQG